MTPKSQHLGVVKVLWWKVPCFGVAVLSTIGLTSIPGPTLLMPGGPPRVVTTRDVPRHHPMSTGDTVTLGDGCCTIPVLL